MIIFLLIANSLLSVAFSITFHYQIDDHDFNEWRAYNERSYRIYRLVFTVFSLHVFRLMYTKLLNRRAFMASATVPHEFIKPLRLYSKLHMLIVQMPVFILSTYGSSVIPERTMWEN